MMSQKILRRANLKTILPLTLKGTFKDDALGYLSITMYPNFYKIF